MVVAALEQHRGSVCASHLAVLDSILTSGKEGSSNLSMRNCRSKIGDSSLWEFLTRHRQCSGMNPSGGLGPFFFFLWNLCNKSDNVVLLSRWLGKVVQACKRSSHMTTLFKVHTISYYEVWQKVDGCPRPPNSTSETRSCKFLTDFMVDRGWPILL